MRGQDRLKTMPGYQQYQKVAQEIPGAVKLGSRSGVTWNAARQVVRVHARRQALSLRRRARTATRDRRDARSRRRAAGARRARRRPGRPSAAGSSSRPTRPTASCKAFYRDRNLWLSDARRQRESRSRPTAARRTRIKYGTASWVYGEELGQTHRDVVVARQHASSPTTASTRARSPTTTCSSTRRKLQSTVDVEAYPKAGRAESGRRSVRLRRRDEEDDARSTCATASRSTTPSSATTSTTSPGRPTARELLFNRTNRRQNILEFAAAQSRRPARCRVDRPRGVADRLGREQPADALPQGRQALHLGVGAQRLDELLPLRSQRQADHAADDAHDVRGRQRSSRSTRRRACCSTRRATATTT